MTSWMVPGPSSVFLVTKSKSYTALSFMWLSQKRGKIWLMLIWQMQFCIDLSAQICLRQLPAGVVFTSFEYLCSPCLPFEKISLGAPIWTYLPTELLSSLPLPVLTLSSGKATLCAHKQVDSTVWQMLGKRSQGAGGVFLFFFKLCLFIFNWLMTALQDWFWFLPYWGCFSIHPKIVVGFPSGSVIKNPPAMQELQEMQVRSMGQEDPLEEGMATHSSILAGGRNLMDRGAWQATVHGVTKSRTQLSTYTVKLMWLLFSLSPVQSESHQMTEVLVMMLQLTCCVTFDKSALFVEPWLFFPLKMRRVYQTRN